VREYTAFPPDFDTTLSFERMQTECQLGSHRLTERGVYYGTAGLTGGLGLYGAFTLTRKPPASRAEPNRDRRLDGCVGVSQTVAL
jgi:hypothetical protein